MFISEVLSEVDEDISILVKLDNYEGSFLCDCGDARRLSVKDCRNLNAIFISHTHIDHFINFDTILRHQLGTQKEVVICGPKGIAKRIQSKIMAFNWNLVENNSIRYLIREIQDTECLVEFELSPRKWELKKVRDLEGKVIFEDDRLRVFYTILDHKIDSIAYLFREKNTIKIDLSGTELKGGPWIRTLKNAYQSRNDQLLIAIQGQEYLAGQLFSLLQEKKGDTLGVIMDHAAHKENHDKIIELFLDCHRVYIECYFHSQDKEKAIENAHSYTTASGQVMKAARVRNPVPIHFSRKYNEQEIREIINEFENALNSWP